MVQLLSNDSFWFSFFVENILRKCYITDSFSKRLLISARASDKTAVLLSYCIIIFCWNWSIFRPVLKSFWVLFEVVQVLHIKHAWAICLMARGRFHKVGRTEEIYINFCIIWAAVSIISTALVLLGRIGLGVGGTGFIA